MTLVLFFSLHPSFSVSTPFFLSLSLLLVGSLVSRGTRKNEKLRGEEWREDTWVGRSFVCGPCERCRVVCGILNCLKIVQPLNENYLKDGTLLQDFSFWWAEHFIWSPIRPLPSLGGGIPIDTFSLDPQLPISINVRNRNSLLRIIKLLATGFKHN